MTRSFLLTMYAPENIGFPRLADYFVFPLLTRLHPGRRPTCSTIITNVQKELNPLDYRRVAGYSEA
jgi:hypothetical protein